MAQNRVRNYKSVESFGLKRLNERARTVNEKS